MANPYANLRQEASCPIKPEGCAEFRAPLGLERALVSRALIELKGLGQLRGDCLERGNRVFGLRDGPPNNDMRRTVIESLRGRGNAALGHPLRSPRDERPGSR